MASYAGVPMATMHLVVTVEVGEPMEFPTQTTVTGSIREFRDPQPKHALHRHGEIPMAESTESGNRLGCK